MVIRTGAVWLICLLLGSTSPAMAAPDPAADGVRRVDINTPDQMQVTGAIRVQYSLSADELFTRQMLQIRYRVESNDAFISLRTEPVAGQQQQYHVLKTRKTVYETPAQYRYRYDLKVLYSSSRSGNQDVRIPELVYSVGGRDSVRLRFASQTIKVKPLPPYLPPYIPLGEVDLQSALSSQSSWYRPLFTGRVFFWELTLRAVNIDRQTVPDLRQQIISNDKLRFLPAQYSLDSAGNDDKLVQEARYLIPFTIESSGQIQLPQLRLQYFDVNSQRLIMHEFSAATLYAISPWLYWSLVLMLVAAALYLITRLKQPLSRTYRCLVRLARARKKIRAARSVYEMRQAMGLLGQAMGWPRNLTLTQWLSCWQRNITAHSDINRHVELLVRSLYARQAVEVDLQRLQSLIGSQYLRQLRTSIRACL